MDNLIKTIKNNFLAFGLTVALIVVLGFFII